MAGHTSAEPEVTRALRSPDPALRRSALGAAVRLDLVDLEGLTSWFEDADAAVVARAVSLVAQMAGPGAPSRPDVKERRRAAEHLVPLLQGEHAEIAAFALGELEMAESAVVAALVDQAGQHTDPLCRESAVAALGALGQGLGAVLEATDDVAAVRRRAVIALANFDDERAEEALSRALDDRDWQVRQIAEDLLAIEPDGPVA